MERSFVILKPDAVQRGLIGEIVARFERHGLKIVAMKMVQVSDDGATALCRPRSASHFDGNPVHQRTRRSPGRRGHRAIAVVRNMVGGTRPGDSAPGTIRGDYGLEVGRNLIHASDGPDRRRRDRCGSART